MKHMDTFLSNCKHTQAITHWCWWLMGQHHGCQMSEAQQLPHRSPEAQWNFWFWPSSYQVFKTGVSGDQWRSMFMSIVFLKSRVGLSLHSSLELPVSLLTFAASTTPKMHHLAQNPGNGNGGNYDKVWHLHWQVFQNSHAYWSTWLKNCCFCTWVGSFIAIKIMTCHSIWQGGDPTQDSKRARRAIPLGSICTWWWAHERGHTIQAAKSHGDGRWKGWTYRGHLNPLNTLAKQVDSFFYTPFHSTPKKKVHCFSRSSCDYGRKTTTLFISTWWGGHIGCWKQAVSWGWNFYLSKFPYPE